MRYKALTLIIVITCLVISDAHAFWLWSPKTTKFVNPKNAVKDSPQEQYDWAMSFYKREEYKRAAEEFVRLIDHYDDSKVAPDAQYYAAVSYQHIGKYYRAFQNYQKVVTNYPFSDKIEEIIKLEFELGELFYHRNRGTLMGMELMVDVEKAIEIFTAIIKNMPYSDYADNAQFMIGQSYKKIQQYNEAVEAFQNLVQEYPTSELLESAHYEIAQCLYLATHKADYDQEATDEAIEEFARYSQQSNDKEFQEEASETIRLLREKKAKSAFTSAQFYKKSKKYRSAQIYYQDILNEYGDTSYAPLAMKEMESIKKYLEEALDEQNQ